MRAVFSNQSKQNTVGDAATTDNTAVQVQVHFPPEKQTTTRSSVLNSVLTELQSKGFLTDDELSVLRRGENAECQLKQLLTILNSRDRDKKIALEQLFDSTCEHGIRFSNLSQVSTCMHSEVSTITVY